VRKLSTFCFVALSSVVYTPCSSRFSHTLEELYSTLQVSSLARPRPHIFPSSFISNTLLRHLYTFHNMTETTDYDVVIVGAGPAGRAL
jgi:hypothetical protein